MPSGSDRSGPAVPRLAATVVLLRPAGAGMEVLLMRRVRSMGFAPGAYVFPGGGVDVRDEAAGLPWTGPSPREWADVLGVDVPRARALVCAAVRETFEETGVLLAGEPGGDGPVLDTASQEWERDRLGLIDRSRSFTDVLSSRGLVLRSEWLRAWSRWITPAAEKRRFDTWFFTAELPPGQASRDVGGEADLTRWIDPALVAGEWERGDMPMLPPTLVTCAQVAECGTLGGVRRAERDIVPLEPEVRVVDGRLRVFLPDGIDYPLPSE